eukprot:3703726-Rhodomonas_salina.3
MHSTVHSAWPPHGLGHSTMPAPRLRSTRRPCATSARNGSTMHCTSLHNEKATTQCRGPTTRGEGWVSTWPWTKTSPTLTAKTSTSPGTSHGNSRGNLVGSAFRTPLVESDTSSNVRDMSTGHQVAGA